MNENMRESYDGKVEILLRMIPIIMGEKVFAIHGGTAINLFLKDLPRLSVDIDLTYIPLADRKNSLEDITAHLKSISDKTHKFFKGVNVVEKLDASKLICEFKGSQVKVEVNQIKRGIIGGEILHLPLSQKAQDRFGMYCEADVVPLTQLYGGKIAAALSRQHPRDIFDIKNMDIPFESGREGLIYSLLGSDRPIYESFAPKMIDQREAISNRFDGMTDIPFSYEDFEETRGLLIKNVNRIMTDQDREFLVSFEKGQPNWDSYEFSYFEQYPSVQWKLLNLKRLAKANPNKIEQESENLHRVLIVDYYQKIEELSQYITADLKERVVKPGMRSFPEDAKQRIRDFVSLSSSSAESLDKIKERIAADEDVQRKPTKWFTDAVRELDEIAQGITRDQSRGMHM